MVLRMSYGFHMDSLWIPADFHQTPQVFLICEPWMPCVFIMEFLYIPYEYVMEFLPYGCAIYTYIYIYMSHWFIWIPYEFPVDSQWIPNVFPNVFPIGVLWIPYVCYHENSYAFPSSCPRIS
jgi:hypothetical protein